VSISFLLAYKLVVHEEAQMFTQPTTQLVQWQDLKVISEADLVLDIAQKNGWKDCNIFGSGDMIDHPVESMGWNLIPAELFEYSIPAEGMDRVLQIINAGVRIQGVVIADDLRRIDRRQKPARPRLSLAPVKVAFSKIGRALLGLIAIAGAVLLGLAAIAIAGAALIALIKSAPILILFPLLFVGAAMSGGPQMSEDPQLIILVDDGNGGLSWITVLTWYD
jgi:hypothetical protein